VHQGDSIYYGDQVMASTDEYAQQAEQIAASAPEVAPDAAEWMPLGVFALTPDGQASGPDPTLFLQLAISKEGVLTGTFHNSATGSTETIEGMADKQSQRVAWNVVGKTRPIVETGIVNVDLSEDSAPADAAPSNFGSSVSADHGRGAATFNNCDSTFRSTLIFASDYCPRNRTVLAVIRELVGQLVPEI
jgi:hypothetical protein